MNRFCTSLAAAALLGLPALCGCANSTSNLPAEERDIGFDINASNSSILTGETVTVTAQSKNTLNRDAKVKWTSTGGNIRTEDGGRIARVSFDQPGTYTITGRLMLDGKVSREDTVDVSVKPVR